MAVAVSGTRGKIGGGDGRSTPEKMPYTELDGCAARVITRDLELAKRERDSEIFHTIFDIADESLVSRCFKSRITMRHNILIHIYIYI